jgi:hypothetical protein
MFARGPTIGSDSGPGAYVTSGPVAAAGTSPGETKIEQIQILIVFQMFVASCQMRTKKVQTNKDYGLSGLH